MHRHSFLKLTRLALVLVALFLGVGLGLAQTQGNANGSNNGIAKRQAVSTPAGCTPGQMQCTNNKHRMEAAIRNADRRAANLRRNKGVKK